MKSFFGLTADATSLLHFMLERCDGSTPWTEGIVHYDISEEDISASSLGVPFLQVKGRRALSPQGGAPPDSINDEEKDTAADTSQVVVSGNALEARGWLMAQGLDEGLAEKLSMLGLDAIAQASEAQLVDEGLPNLKARRIHQLLHERSANVKSSISEPSNSEIKAISASAALSPEGDPPSSIVHSGLLAKKSRWLKVWRRARLLASRT